MSEKNTAAKLKSLEDWIWDAASAIHGAKEANKYKDYILPLIFVKRLCDVFDDEILKLAEKVGGKEKALALAAQDPGVVRFNIPFRPKDIDDDTWSVIRKLSDNIGQQLTARVRDISKAIPSLQGIIDRVDFNATVHGQRDIDDDRLSNLIEAISEKRLGLHDVEPDIIGRSYEYLIRKFAENSGKSAGEFYTPREVGMIMAYLMDADPGMDIYDPTCGSAGLLIKNELVLHEKMSAAGKEDYAPARLYGQEYTPETWAMAKMNMIIHDMEGDIEIGDTFKTPKLKDDNGKLKKFDRIVANPMWNQDSLDVSKYLDDPYDRFPAGALTADRGDWGWMQHIYSSLKNDGKAAVVLDTGSVTRGSGSPTSSKEKTVRKWFVDKDLIEGVIYLPANLFYNTPAPGIILIINTNKPAELKGKIFLINARKEFEKGNPKNFINDKQSEKIIKTYQEKLDIKDFSKFIGMDEIVKHDYNLSPALHIQNEEKIKLESLEKLQEDFTNISDQLVKLEQRLTSTVKMISNLEIDYKNVEVGKIGDYFDVKQGKQVSKSTREGDNQRPFLRTSNIYWEGIDTSELDFMHFTPDEEEKYRLLPGDLLVCEGGDVGRTSIWNGEVDDCYYQNHLHRLRAKDKKEKSCKPKFAYYWMWYMFSYQKALSGHANLTTIANLSKSRLENLSIVVPEPHTQDLIVAEIDLIRESIGLYQDKILVLNNIFGSSLHKTLDGFIAKDEGEDQKDEPN